MVLPVFDDEPLDEVEVATMLKIFRSALMTCFAIATLVFGRQVQAQQDVSKRPVSTVLPR